MTNAEALNLLNSVEGYNKTQVSESAMTFEKGGLSLKVFYVEAQDCFGFTMLNGGNKACKTFEEFKTMLDTYFFINITSQEVKSIPRLSTPEVHVIFLAKFNIFIDKICGFILIHFSS